MSTEFAVEDPDGHIITFAEQEHRHDRAADALFHNDSFIVLVSAASAAYGRIIG